MPTQGTEEELHAIHDRAEVTIKMEHPKEVAEADDTLPEPSLGEEQSAPKRSRPADDGGAQKKQRVATVVEATPKSTVAPPPNGAMPPDYYALTRGALPQTPPQEKTQLPRAPELNFAKYKFVTKKPNHLIKLLHIVFHKNL